MAIRRAAEDAREEMAELLVWQQEQNKIDAELRRQAAAERQRTAQKAAEGPAKPGSTGNARHRSAPVRGGPKVIAETHRMANLRFERVRPRGCDALAACRAICRDVHPSATRRWMAASSRM